MCWPKAKGGARKREPCGRNKLARLLPKFRAMQRSGPRRDQLLLRIGAARKEAGSAFRFLQVQLPREGEAVTRVDQPKLRAAELRDGHDLLRSNLVGEDPAVLWERYVQLAQIEAAFKTMKSELGIRPLYHHLGHRVEAHILVAFLACCLLVTLKNRLQALAPGLTPKAVLEKLSTIQMLDVWLPTTDQRWLVMPRFTQPEADQAILLHKLKLECRTNRRRGSKLESSNFLQKLFACSADLLDRPVETKDLAWPPRPYCERRARSSGRDRR